ncbi:hypothetical protein C9J48_15360 [Photobacterium profundum]|uniref:Uncharacterized protein n=1 Tax=Photobacterium profundum 3TCK TaxID=314280 RepID=Q1YZR7_9GAMM|nr:hypothetical protein [Photobacterium profundum]EAS41808.1 hypothetical protein P3TCK_01300 [Photobacterium profundum 3TCK]PSV61632.1 hypothetical protein C9J48_15360 [Photobacterium profundum]
MKSKLTLLPLLGSILLISLPAFADLKDIGRYDANGLYEPGYVNYKHARERSSTLNQGSNLYEISGHYEPNYVNYPSPESKNVDNKTDLERLSDMGYYNKNGIYEPGYVNYKQQTTK